MFLLRELYDVDLGYKYTLYKHGPYSFELDADIEELRIVGAIDYEIERQYGPRYKPGPAAEAYKRPFDAQILSAMDRVAEFLGQKRVQNLECISTLALCARSSAEMASDPRKLKACVKTLKPHLAEEDIDQGWSELSPFADVLRRRGEKLGYIQNYSY